MTIVMENETEITLDFEYEALIRQVIEAALDHEECPYDISVNIVLTDDESIHEINRTYREIDRPTDVLSFPMISYEKPGDFSRVEEDMDNFEPDTGELLLGDIMISLETMKEQARQYGHSEQRELGFLVAHSMLHLFGYDHMEDAEREDMEQRQREILDSIGLVR